MSHCGILSEDVLTAPNHVRVGDPQRILHTPAACFVNGTAEGDASQRAPVAIDILVTASINTRCAVVADRWHDLVLCDGGIEIGVEHLLPLWPVLHEVGSRLVGVLRLQVGVADGGAERVVVAHISHKVRDVGQARFCRERGIIIDISFVHLFCKTDAGVESGLVSLYTGIHRAALVVLMSALMGQRQLHFKVGISLGSAPHVADACGQLVTICLCHDVEAVLRVQQRVGKHRRQGIDGGCQCNPRCITV